MNIKLTKEQAQDLISFVDTKLSNSTCDHSLRYANDWANSNNVDQDDFIDILEDNGAFCDCEVVVNLPNDSDIIVSAKQNKNDLSNPWKFPKSFEFRNSQKLFSKFLVSKFSEKNKCYAKEGELLVPAPFGTNPKKRVRKSVHFFIGTESGLPNELGFVKSGSPITANQFSKIVRDSAQNDLAMFGEKQAAFFLSRLEKLADGNAVGTHFSEITGLTAKREELSIHKVFLKKM